MHEDFPFSHSWCAGKKQAYKGTSHTGEEKMHIQPHGDEGWRYQGSWLRWTKKNKISFDDAFVIKTKKSTYENTFY